jgi:hypothetical protein
MWGWAEAKANASSASVEEEEEEMAGPPRAMEEEEEEEEDDEPEEEEEDDSDNREDSAGLDEENGGFVSQRRLGPYVTQRLPGIRSIYTSSGGASHGRRHIPVSSRKLDADDAETPINEADHKNGSASGSEYNSRKKKKVAKTRPPASAGSRKRRGSAPRESSGSDHPPPSRTQGQKKIQRQDEEDDEVASDVSTPRHKSGDENTKGEEDKTSPKVPVSPSKFLPSSKPRSAIATSNINPAAAALAALAVIADSVENNTDISLDSKHTAIISSAPTSRKSPVHEPLLLATSASSGVVATPAASRSRTASPDNSDRDEELTESQPIYRSKRATRPAPPRSKKPSDDWRELIKPPVRSPNEELSIDLKIDTALDDTPDGLIVGAVNVDTKGMDVDADMEDLSEVDEDEAEEEVSQQDEEAQPVEDVSEGDDEPVDPEGEGDGDKDKDQEQDLETNEIENDQEYNNIGFTLKMITISYNEEENDKEEKEEPLPGRWKATRDVLCFISPPSCICSLRID